LKIDFNKWWNNYDRAQKRAEKQVRRFVNRKVRWAMWNGEDTFVIKYYNYQNKRTYMTSYIKELGLIIHHIDPYPYCNIMIKIPERKVTANQ